MKTHIICLSLLFFCLVLPTQAQQKLKKGTVYLKNGSIIKGKLVENGPEGVKIQTRDGNLFVFSKNELDRVEDSYPAMSIKNKGYTNQTEMGVLFQSTYYGLGAGISLRTFNGYQFAGPLAIGITTGLEDYNGYVLIPILLSVKGDLWQKQARLFYNVDVGYSSAALHGNSEFEQTQGGIGTTAGIGLKVNITPKTAITINTGYQYQESKYTSNWWWPDIGNLRVTKNKHHRIFLRTGMSF